MQQDELHLKKNNPTERIIYFIRIKIISLLFKIRLLILQ